MPVLRGTVHAARSADPQTIAYVAITNDTWNAYVSQVGFVPVRAAVSHMEAPYAAQIRSGGYALAARIVSMLSPTYPDAVVGPALRILTPSELEAVEERVCEFFQLPDLITGAPLKRPVGSASRYPLWSNIYRGPKQGDAAEDDRTRYIVVSPDSWNATSDVATVVRTTSQFKRDDIEFPLIQRRAARACCGDTTTYPRTALRLDPRDRPDPSVVSAADMRAIAHGIASVYSLDDALVRLGVSASP